MQLRVASALHEPMPANAIKALHTIVADFPDSEQAKLSLVQKLEAAGQLAEAAELLHGLMKHHGETSGVLLVLAKVQLKQGDENAAAALELVERACAAEPTNAECQLWRAKVSCES